jgi:hypothetical protein
MTAMTKNTRTAAAVVALAVAVLAGGCGSGGPRAAASSPTTRPVSPTRPAAPAPAPCPASLPAALATTGTAAELITVQAPATPATVVTVELWQRRGRCWAAVAGPWPGRIGANGFSDHHREDDGTTPTGLYRIGPVVYGNAELPSPRRPARAARLR